MLETSGGADTISGNAGGDVILGGVNNGGIDTLYGDAASPVNALDGADIILGDNGTLDFAYNGDTNLGTLDLIHSAVDAKGGVDTMSALSPSRMSPPSAAPADALALSP